MLAWVVDPRLLATLDAVAREGSFAAAADELALTPSAVSQHITELERRVGRPVLLRRPVRLTESGEVLRAAAIRVHAALTSAAVELLALDEGAAGTVKVGAFTSATKGPVPLAIARFHTEMPGVAVHLLQTEPPDAYTGLLRGDLDIAVTYQYAQSPRPVPEGIQLHEAAIDPFVVALPVNHPLAKRRSVSLLQVAEENLIGTPLTRLPFPWPGESRPRTENPGLRFSGEDYTTTLQLVGHGLGVALLPQLVARQAPPTVRVRELKGQPWHRRIYIATGESYALPRTMRAMSDHLRAALKVRT